MNKYFNCSAAITSSLYTSILLMTFANSLKNQNDEIFIKNKIKTSFENKIRDSYELDFLAKSHAITEVSIPGYFTRQSRDKAAEKYFTLYKKYPDFSKSDEFFSKVDFLFSNPENASKIYFSEDSVKVITLYRNTKFSINYDYGINDSLFILKDDGKKMVIKKCSINNILKTLESYFELSERIETAA